MKKETKIFIVELILSFLGVFAIAMAIPNETGISEIYTLIFAGVTLRLSGMISIHSYYNKKESK